AGSHHLNVPLGAFNTVVLIGSSLTMALAVHYAQLGASRKIVNYILLTIALGAVFLGIKVVEYSDKFRDGLIPGENFNHSAFPGATVNVEIFYSLYFCMTGLHAIHMIIGIGLLLVVAWLASKGRYGPL